MEERPAPVATPPVGLTIGLLLAVTVSALESLTVLSIMPVVAADLDGLSLYGWVFAGFFVASAVSIPIAAQVVDRSGLRIPFAAGLGLFGIGLLVAGFAPSMLVLVGGRLLQGAGSGTLNAVTYATVAIAYPPRERGRVLALISTAWLAPAFVGPLLGAAIAEFVGWRWAFLAMAVFVPIAAALVLPAVTSHDRGRVRPDRPREPWYRAVVPPPHVGRAALVSMLSGSAIYGFLTFAPLGMTLVRGQDSFAAGICVGICSLAWISAAWLHQRAVDRLDLRDSIRFGLLFSTVVSVLLVAVVAPNLPFAAILLGWLLLGVGAGVASQAINLFVMAVAPVGAEGRATSSVQLANTIGAAIGTSALGALFNTGLSAGLTMASSILAIFGVCWVVLGASTAIAWRRRGPRPGLAPVTGNEPAERTSVRGASA
jgi:MFS family permease